MPAPPIASRHLWALLGCAALLVRAVLFPALAANTGQPERSTFASKILGREVPFEILPPPGYSRDGTQRYPVLYWLPDDPAFDLSPQLVHDAIRQHILPPLFVVYVRHGAASYYLDAASGLNPASTVLVHEMIPAVDRAFRTLADRQNRAIQGVGRGGFGSIRFALAHPDVFGSAASYSGTFHPASAFASEPALREAFRETFGSSFERASTNHPVYLAQTRHARIRGRTGLRIVVGKQDRLLAGNVALRDALREARLDVDYVETQPPLSAGSPIPSDVFLQGLEFASSWIGLSRSADRDGPWVNPPAQTPPRLQHHVVFSEILERSVGYSLYLPPSTSTSPPASTNGLPVVFHLHGREEDEGRHLETTGYLDVAIRLGEVPPFAWVWLYGGRGSWFMDSADGRIPTQSVLLDEVIPHIEARWNLGGSPTRRAVDGWGMGGFGAARYAALKPSFFGAALIHNPHLPDLATLPTRFPDAWASVFNTNARFFSETEPFRLLTDHAEILRPRVRFRIVAGERSPALPDARRLQAHLDSLGLSTEFQRVPSVAGIGPDLFRHSGLRDVQFLGNAVTRPEP